jgi:hypothetical protein
MGLSVLLYFVSTLISPDRLIFSLAFHSSLVLVFVLAVLAVEKPAIPGFTKYRN